MCLFSYLTIGHYGQRELNMPVELIFKYDKASEPVEKPFGTLQSAFLSSFKTF